MQKKLIIRLALLLLLQSPLLIVKADDAGGETGPWKRNLKGSNKQVQTGTTTTQVWVNTMPDAGTGHYETVIVPVYTTVPCCAPATDSDACNAGASC